MATNAVNNRNLYDHPIMWTQDRFSELKATGAGKAASATYAAGSTSIRAAIGGYQAFANSAIGRPFMRGVAQGFGFESMAVAEAEKLGLSTTGARGGRISTGFMGWRGNKESQALLKQIGGLQHRASRRFKIGKSMGGHFQGGASALHGVAVDLSRKGAGKRLAMSAGRAARSAGKGMVSGGAIGFGGKVLMPIMAGMAIYGGYKEGGVVGAAKEAMLYGLEWGLFEVAIAALGGPAVWGAAITGAVAYGGYEMGEAAQRYTKRLKHVEMGADMVDPFGTTSTLRQRSISALNNSRINGRMAVGNEALLMHDGAYRR